MSDSVTLEAVLDTLRRNFEGQSDALAMLVFGSLAREHDFGPRSDIDVCVVVPDDESKDLKASLAEDAEWYHRVSEALRGFKRRKTVLVYTPGHIRKICNWYVLRLAVEAKFAFDQAGIAELFVKVIDAAHRAGLEQRWYGDKLLWAVKRELMGQHIRVEVED